MTIYNDNYVGNRSNDPLIDFMLDTVENRGGDEGFDAHDVDHAVERMNEEMDEDWEQLFWSQVLGPAIDALEVRLREYGLPHKDPDEDS